jgi:putative cofactor-binding repeat protein/parallel beta-helix repeat protein
VAVVKKSASLLVLLLVFSFVIVAFSEVRMAKADPVFGIIRIMPDGTVEGTDKIQRNGDVYTFTGDVNGYLNNEWGDLEGFLLVMKDNVVVDGAGHTLQCNGTGVGIFVRSMYNVTVKNFNLEGFSVGVSSYVMDPVVPLEYPMERGHALNCQILNNTITVVDNGSLMSGDLGGWGIYVEFADNTVVSGNTIASSNPQKGICCGTGCINTTLADNFLVGCGMHLFHLGTTTLHNNTVDGKPIVSVDGGSNQVIEDAEQVFLFNCSNMTVKNISPAANYTNTVQLEETAFSEVTGCRGNIVLTGSNNNTVHGNSPKSIKLTGSNYNSIADNIIVDSGVCIMVYGSSSYNEIFGNILLNSSTSPEADALFASGRNTVGIRLGDALLGGSQYNNIYLNILMNHIVGIECDVSSNNSIHENYIADSNVGISLSGSYQNRVYQNNITNCLTAVSIRGSHNVFYNNNFVENSNQVSIRHTYLFTSDIITEYSTNNTFNLDLPTGGNYWSNYNGTDTDGDGVGDTPYTINQDTVDSHPLMEPHENPVLEIPETIPEFPSWIILYLFFVATLVGVVAKRKFFRST